MASDIRNPTSRRLAAILAADVVGYSRLMGADEDGTHRQLKAHIRELVEPVVRAHVGRIVKTTGDGILAEFPSAVGAVACAVELQRGMVERNTAISEEQRMEFRIGVNLGDVIVENGDLFGDGVNIAARLEALAEPGGIYISGTVYDHVKSKLKLSYVDLGTRTLKNIAEPVRVFQVRLSGVPERPGHNDQFFDKPSLAVLPFDNLGGDTEVTLFADSLVEDIITGLSRIKSLLVIARNSTFTYKGRSVSVKEVARDLNVQYVMEGSVRRAGDKVRVTAQLIDASAGAHIWAERFDRVFVDPFVLQDELTSSIVASTDQQLYLNEGRAGVPRRDRSNTELWSLLQRSWARLHDLTPEAVAEARELAERALAMASNNARANFLVGCMLFHEASMLYRPDYEAAMNRARELVARSIALDETDEHAHWILANIFWSLGDIESAMAEHERSLEINPNWSLGLADLGESLCYAGRWEEGLPKVELAIRMNPRDPSIFFRFNSMATGHYFAGDYEAAERWARKTVQRRRQYFLGHVYLIASLIRRNRIPEGRAAASDLLQLYPDFKTASLRPIAFRPEDFARLSEDLRAAGIPD